MKYEYKVVKIKVSLRSNKTETDIQEKCNELAELGREFVNFQSYDLGSKFILIFRREKKS